VQVFETLAKAYNLSVSYDAAKLAKCTLTASLNDDPLPEKLQVIAQSTELDIQLIDNQIIVSGLGCQ
jgi:transmembrane sensor